MKFFLAATALTAAVTVAAFPEAGPKGKGPSKPKPVPKKPLVDSKKLQNAITKKGLEAHAKKLMSFAKSTPEYNRAFGGKGHNMTVDYIKKWFGQWPEYYKVETQSFVHPYTDGFASLSVDGVPFPGPDEPGYFTYGVAGTVTAEIVVVNNLGCELVSYSKEFPSM